MPLSGNISMAILFVIILTSILAPIITPYDPYEIDLDRLKEPPSLAHPFGTDEKGRDILTRILYGGRISLSVAVTSLLISFIVGFLAGTFSGYMGGRIDIIITGIVDLLLAFPSLLLAIGFSVIMPQSVFTIMIALALTGWPGFARLIRGYVIKIKEENYIYSARAIGCGEMRILFRHVMPQCFSLGLVYVSMKLGGFILSESALSFLGLGAQPPIPTWGGMVSSGRVYILGEPWIVIFPGLFIGIISLSFNILGDVLQGKRESLLAKI